MMYSFILLSLVVAVYCHQPVPELYDADKYEAKVKRLDEVEELIDRVTTRIQNLKDKRELRQKQKDDADRRSKSILLRLDRMKLNDGSFHCDKPDKEFKCRKNTQCVNNILVCDNVPDCEDKSDEDPDLCKFPAEVGDVWKGNVVFYYCSSLTVDNTFDIFWQVIQRLPTLVSYATVKLSFTVDNRVGTSATLTTANLATLTHNYGSQMAVARVLYNGVYHKTVMEFEPGEAVVYIYSYVGISEKPCSTQVMKAP